MFELNKLPGISHSLFYSALYLPLISSPGS